ncbi:hypothetical protein ACFRCW_26650 [Streptomyces sp. NPDC056653]|uniref:hypothetical protein n=1 Tax=Streptomyces sp. NPDC056653 TaxID=3345894 RepID=UPI003673BC01
MCRRKAETTEEGSGTSRSLLPLGGAKTATPLISLTEEQYADFVGAYGRDLRVWPGFAMLCAIQEFKMTTWLMQNVSEGDDVAQEVGRRIASLHDDAAPRNWLPYREPRTRIRAARATGLRNLP